jgi:5'-3' exoribonuclease 1
MGIPSYFSYIVKNHPKIIKRFYKNVLSVDNLYLDCNSIIYDAYSKLTFDKLTESVSLTIINAVIKKIEEYLEIIAPKKTVIIAFDGVAPVAKLEQQRSRRYKSWYQNNVSRSIFGKVTPDVWNTAAITPGTIFMGELNKMVSDYFKKSYSNSNSESNSESLLNIMVTGSDQPGEGEHKLFEYIRQNPEKHLKETTVIYGLDADLIMLSINHLPVCNNIYLFRETPHFIQSINSELEPDANYFLDIPELTQTIIQYLNKEPSHLNVLHEVHQQPLQTETLAKVYDYIFLCFFLGNDFMPHFPALNIRTGGIDKMLNAYRATIKPTEYLITGTNLINWNNVRKLVSYLAKLEEVYITNEHKSRDNKERYSRQVYNGLKEKEKVNKGTDSLDKDKEKEEKFRQFEATPLNERELERYINPYKPYWQTRYYRALFDIKSDSTGLQTKDICLNYLEGLEWNLKYYTSGCPDWRWVYKYNYPPLLQDLIKYIPVFSNEFVPAKPQNPVSELVQLCYVLPKHSLNLLPPRLHEALIKAYPEQYRDNCAFVWAYCRYFWESHIIMDEINIDELERFINR